MMFLPIQFRLSNPYQNSPKVRVQLLDTFGNLLLDGRVPKPEQTFPVVPGLNRLGFALNDGPYQLMDVRIRVISGEGYSPCDSQSAPLIITVPAPGEVPFLEVIEASCGSTSQTPFLEVIDASCESPGQPAAFLEILSSSC